MQILQHQPLFRFSSSLRQCYSGFLYLTFLPLLVVAPVYAEAPVNAQAIEEIIITANKREQSLQDFSGSISVINNFSGIYSIGDIASQVPGFSILDAGPRNPTGLIIRGIRMDEVDENDVGGDGSAVASYVDNIPLQGYFVPPAFSLKDLQQVEVLRGPQGTLYGNASIGGLVRYITAKPDLTKYSVVTTGKISQTKESDDINYDTDLVVNMPIVTDSLGVRLMLGKTENQGFIDNPYLITGAQDDINDDETRQARVSLLWQASDAFSLASSYHFQKINVGDRQATNERFTGDEYTASSRYLQPMQGELQLASLDATYDFSWASLTASVNRYDYQHKESADQTDFLLALGGSYYSDYEDFSGYTASNVDVVKDSVELRLVSPSDQTLRWLVGGFYSHDDLDVFIADYVPGFADYSGEDRPNDLDYVATQTETLSEYAAYAELAYDLTSKWEASIGARYFRYDDELEVCLAFYPYYPDLPCEDGTDVNDDVLKKFSSRYTFNEQVNVYLSVAEGYRRGGANYLPPDSMANRYYNPDQVINYELGLRTHWLDQRLQFTAALFALDWDDIQVQTISEGVTVWSNAGEARSQGVELDLSAKLNALFAVRAGYSFTDAEITETVMGIDGGNANAYDGDRLPGAPRSQWNLILDYTQSFNTAVVDGSIGMNRMGEIYTALNSDFYNYQKLDSFTTLNASLGVTRGNWRVGMYVNNIEDTRGITGKRSDEWHGEQGQFEYITRPRTFCLAVTYRH